MFVAWQQHDVQELCRVMFDALEITWKDTSQADLINQLYQGKLKDYVKCLKVRHHQNHIIWSCHHLAHNCILFFWRYIYSGWIYIMVFITV